MKKAADIMGMPVTVVIVDDFAKEEDIDTVFDYLRKIDEQFSPYKSTSEVSRLNKGSIAKDSVSLEFENILLLSEQTRKETNGYFDIHKDDGSIDPSGLVKGYAIHEAAEMLKKNGYKNFYVEIAGDIEVAGLSAEGQKWKVGIENPFKRKEIIKIVYLSNKGIATSGTYIRGQHIYNPVNKTLSNVASVSVIADNIFDADRFATAVFAMGEKGILFLENHPRLEGYMVKEDQTAVMTSGFSTYTKAI